MNLLSTTPANPLFPGWFVNCNWTWSPKHGYKFHFITWNSFHFQGFPVIFHSANLRDLVFTRGCFSPRSLSNMFGRAGKSNGHCMDIFSRRVYQGCVCHLGVTSTIASTFSRRNLFITWPIKLKSGNAKRNILFYSCCIPSIAKTYSGSWWHSLGINISTAGVLKSLVVFR